MTAAKRIISVGLEPSGPLLNLLQLLGAQGYELVESPPTEKLPLTLNRLGPAVVIVYNAWGKSTARLVLNLLAEGRKKYPVIVLVDRSDLNQYYQLMSEGAFDYFELSDPRWVEHAVQSAETAAASVSAPQSALLETGR